MRFLSCDQLSLHFAVVSLLAAVHCQDISRNYSRHVVNWRSEGWPYTRCTATQEGYCPEEGYRTWCCDKDWWCLGGWMPWQYVNCNLYADEKLPEGQALGAVCCPVGPYYSNALLGVHTQILTGKVPVNDTQAQQHQSASVSSESTERVADKAQQHDYQRGQQQQSAAVASESMDRVLDKAQQQDYQRDQLWQQQAQQQRLSAPVASELERLADNARQQDNQRSQLWQQQAQQEHLLNRETVAVCFMCALIVLLSFRALRSRTTTVATAPLLR
eukprot:gnl/TRDRNA2_/TRDRNA2_159623_c0_seq1.p1 gnl/TRDRNA2_/TRDRNA2_159623_c0~~gnl/TRDRNA2_/TRDRNA2_159623_c0_seq1.p1  ORF type:complete len:273 (+),score=38.94 gnl/TRDRNA2_/TRDRNA2_159623_c0_seq1:95-913(+)